MPNALERLLDSVEEANVEDGYMVDARPWLVSRARHCGVLVKRRPTGADLHAAILDAMGPSDAVEDASRSRSRAPRRRRTPSEVVATFPGV